ncbi:ornithine cyclodeaminase family protein [Georgenia subflava]|uniref:Ornithine cyclodeaminase family protein n=2 Tax=Georgenia subflava TaxID=1622177 RepID=A0A6N7EKK0_9MICO|nr:ornithine cyclodeaminase family protein [Georgenia subflava]
MRLISAADVAARTSTTDAVDALEAALRSGLDPEHDVPRSRVTTQTGELLIMPSTLAGLSGVKLLSSTPDNAVRDQPAIQGAYLLFEGPGQRPAALIDGIALTNLRTPAVSALAVRHLAPPAARQERVAIFGTGPQARAHALALLEERDVASIDVVGRKPDAVRELADELGAAGVEVSTHPVEDCAAAVREADIICLCTGARTALFDGALVKDSAVVVAIGSHFTDTRETDDTLVGRATVVVESRATTLREGGDVVIPLGSGVLREEDVVTLADVVTGRHAVDPARPRFFKTTGMPWEDLVVAAEVYRAADPDGADAR